MGIAIAPLAREHFTELREVLDVIAREGKYLAFLQAPPVEAAVPYYEAALDRDSPYFVALDGARVVGWCDIVPTLGESRAHVGTLGIGLLSVYRGSGNGEALMKSAIDKAWLRGFTRVELNVRADNLRAKRLYERLGFVLEGTHPRSFRVDGQYFDSYSMALMREVGP